MTFCGWCGLARPSRLRRSHTTGMKSKVHPTYKTKYRVANWPAYHRALVRRGDVTVWVSSEAIAAWTPRRSGRRGGQRRYSNLAIETAMTLRLLYHLPLHQAEGWRWCTDPAPWVSHARHPGHRSDGRRMISTCSRECTRSTRQNTTSGIGRHTTERWSSEVISPCGCLGAQLH